ncbi:MAG: PhzF family phenazine biosynthesis protein [Rhizomicrobium sp.]
MVKLKLWQVDAFAEKPLEGNPAAIVPLDHWTDAGLMQKIANENNLAETAFFVKTAPGKYDLRWFTPTVEVPLCGHATLASAWTIFEILDPSLNAVSFETKSGTLTVERGADGRNRMSLPSDRIAPFQPSPDYAERIARALGSAVPSEVLKGANIVAVFDKPSEVRGLAGASRIADAITPDMGLIATAPGDDGFDFISRYFAPHHGIAEDPVTGSAHCSLTPYWSKRLGKKTLKARQVSPRGGNLICTDDGARTVLEGRCALYMTGEISI